MKKRSWFLAAIIILVVAGYNIIGRLYPLDYYDIVNKYSAQYDLDPFLIMAMIKTESGFEAEATSGKDAKGLMQITDDTARWCCDKLGIANYEGEQLYDPEFNIRLGTFYADYLLDRYEGELTCVLSAYNAGMGNADKWLCDKKYSPDGKSIVSTPFNETTGYLNKVRFNYKIYEFLYGGKDNV